MNRYDEPKIDCHLHIFDPARFPYAADTVYRPSGQEVATVAQFQHLMDAYGVTNALLVGPVSGYGNDNACLLDALAQGKGRFRGIAMMPTDASVDQLADLKAQGVVGVALNVPMCGADYVLSAQPFYDKLNALGMFVQIQVEADQLAPLKPVLESSGVQLIVDHCGRPDVAAGIGQAGFQALLDLAGTGRTTVKLSGFSKFAKTPYPYPDTQPYLAALLDAFGAERCMWGSDWPFLRAPERIDYGTLLTLVERQIPDAGQRHQVLYETPRTLFGFGAA
ncbi:amidohydrolase family protein [Paraburkholderia sp.]|uniref:amidohydrolase family protein n=1 Tax=Paraburkholderia sp. TaxID=1926495 RepID=UPI00238B441C|nr:amidohydrolase family protein [Paraburkholderia sp.]MDE1179234.1 amidohydrolase family protein [Paraburkholderia sp.]